VQIGVPGRVGLQHQSDSDLYACHFNLQGTRRLLVVVRMLAFSAGLIQQPTSQHSASARTWAQTM
jgi:hypothetical protein